MKNLKILFSKQWLNKKISLSDIMRLRKTIEQKEIENEIKPNK